MNNKEEVVLCIDPLFPKYGLRPYFNSIASSVSQLKENGASAQLPETFDLLTGRMDEGISTDVLDGMMLSLKETSHFGNLDCFQKVCDK